MKIKKAAAVCAVVGTAVAGLVLATPANADPVSNSYVLVGSDTLQDVANALVNGTTVTGVNVRASSASGNVASYDAFGSAAIQTKPFGPYFARPAGSGDGVKALAKSIDGKTTFAVSGNTTPAALIPSQVDIARSSSGPGSAQNASGPLAYVPFGRDAVSYAIAPGTGAGLEQLSTAQLTQIYNCSLTTINGVAIKPVLPQAASGTRKFFLSAIGVSSIGSCVNDSTLAENDGTVLSQPGQIIPFSVASWVAQKNGAAQNRTGSSTLGSALGTTAPFTGSGNALVPNAAYYNDSTWGRDTYLVAEFARLDNSSATYDANLAALLDPTKGKSLTNFGTLAGTSGAVKSKFGFLAPTNTTVLRANFPS